MQKLLVSLLAVTIFVVSCRAFPENVPWRRLRNAQEINAYLEALEHERVGQQQAVANSGRNSGDIYAVLVAGSNGWYNYRHQADVCHAYQILIKHGVKAENIITMMYDDIAENPQNPNRGVVINKPNGKDVYKGVVIDYKGDDVTPENFLKVLTGDSSAGKKVLKSGPNDNVFVYFTDHGAPGLVAFPNGILKVNDLSSALKTMHIKKMYKEFTFYLEACESGSMFEDGYLPNNASMYGITAANDHESSYACYLDEQLNTYLGDCFSVAWMEDTDQNNIESETLQAQFEATKKTYN
jgi:legumain